MARVAGRRGRSDAGILSARVREGLLRGVRCLAGAIPHVPAHVPRRLRRQRAQGGRAAEARRRRHADPDRLRRSRARAPASVDQRHRRFRRLLSPRVASRPVRSRGEEAARRLRGHAGRPHRFAIFEQYDLAGGRERASDLRRDRAPAWRVSPPTSPTSSRPRGASSAVSCSTRFAISARSDEEFEAESRMLTG